MANEKLPVEDKKTIEKCIAWLRTNFEDKIKAAVNNTPFTVEHIVGIAMQETAYKWKLWLDKYSTEIILQRCIFDASGDLPNTTRSAFPVNRDVFEKIYGADFTKILILEGNKQRAMPQSQNPKGFQPAPYLYKGYGIFQYDLQFVKEDRAFFEQKKWYSFDECLSRVMLELNSKIVVSKGDIKMAIRMYNGSGQAAVNYSNNVMQYVNMC